MERVTAIGSRVVQASGISIACSGAHSVTTSSGLIHLTFTPESDKISISRSHFSLASKSIGPFSYKIALTPLTPGRFGKSAISLKSRDACCGRVESVTTPITKYKLSIQLEILDFLKLRSDLVVFVPGVLKNFLSKPNLSFAME